MSSTDYIFQTDRNTYHIIITNNTFTIDGEMHRIRHTNGRHFELDDGLAGSEFTITNDGARAHYVIYGSGRPIIIDVHGTLTRIQPQKTTNAVPGDYPNQEDYIKALVESRGYPTEKTTHQL